MDSTQEKPKRKIRAPDRYREDGTYYNGPKDPKAYYTNYYHTKGAEEVDCPHCNATVKRNYLYKHCLTRACRKEQHTSVFLTSKLPELGEESSIHVKDTSC